MSLMALKLRQKSCRHVLGLIKKPTDPVVVLGEGDLTVALNVKAHRFSATAKEKIEAAGGTIEVLPLS
jgi:large subunit ribosomal protein L15